LRKTLLLSVKIFIVLITINTFVHCEQIASKKLIGKINWNDWKNNCGWDLIATYEYFSPDSIKINKLKKLISLTGTDSLKFIIFATIHCEECKENLPQLMKILKELKIPESIIELYGLDDKLEEPTKTYKNYDIDTTPILFIEYKNKLVAEISYPYIWIESMIEVFESLK